VPKGAGKKIIKEKLGKKEMGLCPRKKWGRTRKAIQKKGIRRVRFRQATCKEGGKPKRVRRREGDRRL